MASVTLQSTGVTDTFLDSGAPTANYGSFDGIFVGEESGGTSRYRTLIKFDLDDPAKIPAGSTINTAVITLTVQQDISANARTLSVYRVKRAWVVSQATENIYSTANNWQTAGCAGANDREATDIGTATQPASPAVDSTLDITLTASAVQAMISGGSFTNNGFLLQVATETDDAIKYYATDHATSSKRPKLVVTYTTTTGAAFLLNFC